MNAKPMMQRLAMATMAVVGCTPSRLGVRRDDHSLLPPLGQSAPAKGQLIAPKRCDVRMAVLSRPLNDEAINKTLWSVADEQALAPEVRQTLESNGLRMGLLTGDLPPAVEAILQAPPPHKVEPTMINIASGDNSLFSVAPGAPKVSLIVNRNEHPVGKDFTDAKGMFRVTATHDGSNAVALRFVPEIHHGPVQHRYTPDASTNPFAEQQFMMKDGQQEDTLRELAATIALKPGQVAVVGCEPDRPSSVGHFLLTEPEGNSDRILQKVLLIWASQGSPEAGAPVVTAPDTPVRRGPRDIARTTDRTASSTPNQTKERPL
jgi:hypothetical protein